MLLMGKSTISRGHGFNSYVCRFTRGYTRIQLVYGIGLPRSTADSNLAPKVPVDHVSKNSSLEFCPGCFQKKLFILPGLSFLDTKEQTVHRQPFKYHSSNH